jgi:hypothetical protein
VMIRDCTIFIARMLLPDVSDWLLAAN